jgi:hypothetical protein
MRPKVTLDTEVEDLSREFPEAVGFLTKKGVRCIRCGEPVWGTLGKLFEEDRVANPQILVDELNDFLTQK